MERTLLGAREADFVRRELEGLPRAVTLLTFSDGRGRTGAALEQLARELADVVPEVAAVAVHRDAPQGAERYLAFGIDHEPALAITPDAQLRPDNGIRFFGFPGGYEFTSLLDAIARVSRGEHGLSPETAAYLLALGNTPLHLEVFVTPTCPYCPRMVQLAHRMALLSPAVRADMIDAAEFDGWAQAYGVRGVPLTVAFDGAVRVEGAVPEGRLLRELQGQRHPLPDRP